MLQVHTVNYKVAIMKIKDLFKYFFRKREVEQTTLPTQPLPSGESVHSELSADFGQLCMKLAEMVKMYDQMAKQMPEGETRDLAEDFSEQIITTLSLCNGCSVIANDTTFDSRSHTPVPFSMVENGTPIQSFVRLGIAIGDQVIIPARVKV